MNHKPTIIAGLGLIVSIGLIGFYTGVVKGKIDLPVPARNSNMITKKVNFKIGDMKTLYSEDFDVSSIDKIDVVLLSESVDFVKSKSDKIHVEIKANTDTDDIPSVKAEGSALKIEQKNVGLGFTRIAVEIAVPENKILESVQVAIASGSIDVDNIRTKKEFNMTSASGSISVEDTFADSFKVASASGSIRFEESECKTIEAVSASGSFRYEDGKAEGFEIATSSGSLRIELNNMITKDSQANSMSGSVRIALPKNNNGFVHSYSSGSGSVDNSFVDIDDKKGTVTYKDGGPRITTTCSSGSTRITSKD